MNSITLNAPAKINLYLEIINKRKDGYHNIETIFQKIDLCDNLKVSIIPRGISLTCNYPHIPTHRGNLAYKAAYLMKKEFGLREGLHIDLKKKIPVAAGLGGGSSDAASVIIAVNRLFNLNISAKKLILLAKSIGADVPFFVSGHNCASGKGIGERLKEVRSRYSFYILLLLPKLRIYTKTIYSKVSFPLTKTGLNVNIIARILSGRKSSKKSDFLYNRLEDVVLSAYPIVKKGKEVLSLYTDRTLLSGSGPTIFALFDKRKEAMRARDGIKRDNNWQLVLTKTI
ncbi:MAG: 4-(cytidine 5'-diphospho)-2-C-methyl-D-erythritol kinase [Candidatus Omnitrophota bacterium]